MTFNSSLFNSTPLNQNLSQSNAKEIQLPNPPTDTVSSLKFSPSSQSPLYLMATSWDKSATIWEISTQENPTFRLRQSFPGPLLDCCWSPDSTKAVVACTDSKAYLWDLVSNQVIPIATHDAPISTVHWIQAPTYTCIMTGSWDCSLRFWSTQPNGTSLSPIKMFKLPNKIYCADVHYPMAAVATADTNVYVYGLENEPVEFKKFETQLNSRSKFQIRCIKIFVDIDTRNPSGYIEGITEGRAFVKSVSPENDKNTFSFRCHRVSDPHTNLCNIYPVNKVIVHPVHHTLATFGSDGKFCYWDRIARTKLKELEPTEQQPITTADIDSAGNILAYAVGYDWSKGHEYNDQNKKPHIFLRQCFADMTPSKK